MKTFFSILFVASIASYATLFFSKHNDDIKLHSKYDYLNEIKERPYVCIDFEEKTETCKSIVSFISLNRKTGTLKSEKLLQKEPILKLDSFASFKFDDNMNIEISTENITLDLKTNKRNSERDIIKVENIIYNSILVNSSIRISFYYDDGKWVMKEQRDGIEIYKKDELPNIIFTKIKPKLRVYKSKS